MSLFPVFEEDGVDVLRGAAQRPKTVLSETLSCQKNTSNINRLTPPLSNTGVIVNDIIALIQTVSRSRSNLILRDF